MRSLILQAILIVFFLAQQVISFTPLFVLSTSSTQGSSQRLFSVPSLSRWHEFDYTQQWYPVSWVSDLPRSQPHQVSLLDQTYAVVMDGTSFVTAYVDQCPHRAAVLSEGRYVKSTRRLQCAYHGWSFDANGTCVDIPQNNKLYSTNTRATTVPAIVHQGLVWLWPEAGGFPNKDPPTITELNDPAFKVVTAVRDFPVVDWTLLISNILDPDHGLFAHRSIGFDWYSASTDDPLSIVESFDNHGWTMTSRVRAVDKLLARDAQKRGKPHLKNEKPLVATSTFYAPTTSTLCRRDPDNGNRTNFMTAFWVCPTKTGEARFMTASISRSRLTPPRWSLNLFLNSFLDQDTVLVASQQPPTLKAELESYERAGVESESDTPAAPLKSRQKLFKYQSPTDKSVRLIDKFWDETCYKVPNRIRRLKAMKDNMQLPSRQIVLDRDVQHLQICPDSQVAVRNAKILRFGGVAVTAAWFAAKLSGKLCCKNIVACPAVPVVSTLVAWVANKVYKGFFYSYTKQMCQKDLQSIATKAWVDPE